LRRPHREIEIFSMSVLDMFASALGAFIMVSIILFPFYKQDIDAQLTASIEALANKRGELRSIEESVTQAEQRNARQKIQVDEVQEQRRQNTRCVQELAVCVSALAETFLIVVMQWEDNVDLDLYVTYVSESQCREFSWDKSNQHGERYPDTEAQLSFDNGGGPGIEIWLDPSAKPGRYKIEYRRRPSRGNPVTASGYYIDRTGRQALPSRTMTDTARRVVATTLVLSTEGKITSEPDAVATPPCRRS
jgi:hypothetical protein